MALATRCPKCQSMFRVVSDQLKLRGGLVRCGSCRHVFDAIGSLSYVDEAASAGAAVADAPAPAPAATAQPLPAAAAAPGTAPAADAATAAATDPASGANAHARSPAARATRSAAAPSDALAVPTLFVPDVAAGLAAQAQAAQAVDGSAATDDSAAAPADESPAFLRADHERRGFSIVYSAGALLLALLAAMQLVVVFRTELVTQWPQARPQLSSLCRVFGCNVGWPTRAELLSVIGTELQAVPGTDILELTAVIRNRASHPVALPAVEVTLTDSQNRTVARKVFAPVDYLISSDEPSSRIDEGLAAASDLVVRIVFEARGLNVTGFTVYHFYL